MYIFFLKILRRSYILLEKMETVKQPAMLLGSANTALIIGGFFYFYRQLNAIKTELDDLTSHLKSSVNKFVEIQNNIVTKEEVVNAMNGLNKKIEDAEKAFKNIDLDNLPEIEEALFQLADELGESGVQWSYPPRKNKRRGKGKSRNRRKPRRNYSEESSEEDDFSEDEGSDQDIREDIQKTRRRQKKRNKD